MMQKESWAKFFKASFILLFVCTSVFPLRQGSEVSIGHGEGNTFYIPGVGWGFPRGGFGIQIGRVTEVEHKYGKPVIAT